MKSQKKQGESSTAVEVAPATSGTTRPWDLEPFERMLAGWPEWAPFRRFLPVFEWGRDAEMLRVDEFRRNGDIVIRAEIPGIDPTRDVDVSVSDGMLTIRAERREESEGTKDGTPGYVRHELRYGSFHRSLPMPRGVAESDVTASYKDGILEIRVPAPAATQTHQVEVTAA